MNFPYKLEISPDKMKAWIIPTENPIQIVSEREVDEWLASLPITFGIKKEVESLLLNVEQVMYPLLYAEGQSAENGHDGELILEYTKGLGKQEQPFNFRNIIEIPSRLHWR